MSTAPANNAEPELVTGAKRNRLLLTSGMGWMFVADPDGNWVELVGPL